VHWWRLFGCCAVLGAAPSAAASAQTHPADRRLTSPPAMLLGLHVGSTAGGDLVYRVLGARMTIPLRWRALVAVSGNWHSRRDDDAGEATVMLRVHPLPAEFYLGVGVGLRYETDDVSGRAAVDGEWLGAVGLQVHVWRLWPYAEAQVVNAGPVLKLLVGMAVQLRSDGERRAS
jgi:hypothetical protein